MKRLLFLALATVVPHLKAVPVTVNFETHVSSVFDYTTLSYRTIPTVGGFGTLTFDTEQISVVDYGTTTITTFGGIFGTTWNSPITHLIPADPYLGAYGPFSNSYTFPNTSDYPSEFIEQAASQANTYQFIDGTYSYYHIELRATKRSSPRAADGTADYGFTASGLIDYYNEFATTGAHVYFAETYAVYTFKDGVPIYTDGAAWEDYSARITSVSTSVPDTAGYSVLLIGTFFLICSRRLLKFPRDRKQGLS